MSQAPSGWSQVRPYLLLSLVLSGHVLSPHRLPNAIFRRSFSSSFNPGALMDTSNGCRIFATVMRCDVIGWYVHIVHFRIIADYVLQCDALNEYFDLNTPSGSIETYAYLKSVSSTTTTERKPIFSFTPPAVRSPESTLSFLLSLRII